MDHRPADLRHPSVMLTSMFLRSAAHRHIEDALGDDPRVALVAVRKLVEDDLPWLERRAVRLARANGFSWATIGRLLCRSRQAVRKRYGAIDGTREPIVMPPVDDAQRVMAAIARSRADDRRRRELAELDDGEVDAVAW